MSPGRLFQHLQSESAINCKPAVSVFLSQTTLSNDDTRDIIYASDNKLVSHFTIMHRYQTLDIAVISTTTIIYQLIGLVVRLYHNSLSALRAADIRGHL
jgi:hypothetical protein